MTPEEQIKQLTEEKAALEATISEKDKEIEGLNKTVSDKDALIEQKNQDIIGARRKYKTLSEMTDEEKAGMTDEEIKRKEEQDAIYEQQAESEKQRQADRAKEIEERKQNAIKKIAGNDEEYARKVIENFDRIKDADKAFTEGEISTFAQMAANMVGEPAPEPVREAINNNANSVAPVVGETSPTNFADSEAGRSLAANMGLASTNAPKEGEGS